MNHSKVFLGGTTAGKDWRPEIIEMLKCEYFNPVVKDWNTEAQSKEKQEKNDAGISLYVLTPAMKGSFSVAEIVEDSITRRNGRTVLCILDKYDGSSFAPDVKRSLDAVTDMARGYGCHIVEDLPQAAGLVNSLAEKVPSEVYLLKNKWLSLKKKYGPTGEYIFSHEDRCQGHIVAVLPTRQVPGGYQVLARQEFTPPWSISALNLSCITGGVDPAEISTPQVSALRELREETGITVPERALVSLGTVRGTKSTDTVYHLYTADVTDYLATAVDVEGEDDNEKRAYNEWMDPSAIGTKGQDPILYTLLFRKSSLVGNPTHSIYEDFSW